MMVVFSGKPSSQSSGILRNGTGTSPKGPYKMMGNSSSVAAVLSPAPSLLVCQTQPVHLSNPFVVLASIRELSNDESVISVRVLATSFDFVSSIVPTPDMLPSPFAGTIHSDLENAISTDHMYLASPKHNTRCTGSVSLVDCQLHPLASCDDLAFQFHNIVDSGAMAHMVPFQFAFTHYHVTPGGYVVLADKTHIPSDINIIWLWMTQQITSSSAPSWHF